VIGAEEICPFPVDPKSFSLPKADYKFFLSEFHAQGPAFLALELRPQIKLEEIAKIEVFTYHFAWFEIGSGAEKWQPTTRETADHSMPYVVAAVLIDGAYTDAIFEPERFGDPRTLELMKKITITEDAEFNRRYPASLPCRMTVTLKSGEQNTAELSNPIGHHDRPMSDAQVVEKFKGLAERKLSPAQSQKVLDRAWRIESDPQWAALFDELRVDRK
jgi:2-methylcitrate dehydratase